MTNVCMKFEKAGLNKTLVIVPTKLYTTYRWTDRCKAIYHLFFEGVHNNVENGVKRHTTQHKRKLSVLQTLTVYIMCPLVRTSGGCIHCLLAVIR